jgi:hypothetical protein
VARGSDEARYVAATRGGARYAQRSRQRAPRLLFRHAQRCCRQRALRERYAASAIAPSVVEARFSCLITPAAAAIISHINREAAKTRWHASAMRRHAYASML